MRHLTNDLHPTIDGPRDDDGRIKARVHDGRSLARLDDVWRRRATRRDVPDRTEVFVLNPTLPGDLRDSFGEL